MKKCWTVFLIGLLMCVTARAVSEEYWLARNDYTLPSRPIVIVTPIYASQWTPETKLWLARSCIGEIGFDTVEECIGIAWVYATRAKQKDADLQYVIRKYSSPLKASRESQNPRRWIFGLNLEGTKPEHWPKTLRWENHRAKWMAILDALDDWAAGNRSNPVPGADHFGGHMDTPDITWKVLKTPETFKNIFYTSTGFGYGPKDI